MMVTVLDWLWMPAPRARPPMPTLVEPPRARLPPTLLFTTRSVALTMFSIPPPRAAPGSESWVVAVALAPPTAWLLATVLSTMVSVDVWFMIPPPRPSPTSAVGPAAQPRQGGHGRRDVRP